LAECPLSFDNVSTPALDVSALPGSHAEAKEQQVIEPLVPARPVVTWTISKDWLHAQGRQAQEYVESVAVNSNCLEKGGSAFSPDELGCVVVGTTSGRIVQLRGASTGGRRLVPERAMQQRPRAIGRGSLHVFPSGLVVALRRSTGTVQFFDSEEGTTVGEWRLPSGVRWLTLCGGGDGLFVLGLRNGTTVELRRFPLPFELTSFHRLVYRQPTAAAPTAAAEQSLVIPQGTTVDDEVRVTEI
jgi:hypothetical protein